MRLRNVVLGVLITAYGVSIVAGCASIMHGTSQEVSFQSTPAGAAVTVVDALDEEYGSCETPCTLDLKRKREYQVIFRKEGHSPVEINIHRKSDGWIWGNILFGGVIGLIVDFSNGAAYKLSPDEIQATLNPQTTLNYAPGEDIMLVVDFESLSQQEQRRIVSAAEEVIQLEQ